MLHTSDTWHTWWIFWGLKKCAQESKQYVTVEHCILSLHVTTVKHIRFVFKNLYPILEIAFGCHTQCNVGYLALEMFSLSDMHVHTIMQSKATALCHHGFILLTKIVHTHWQLARPIEDIGRSCHNGFMARCVRVWVMLGYYRWYNTASLTLTQSQTGIQLWRLFDAIFHSG